MFRPRLCCAALLGITSCIMFAVAEQPQELPPEQDQPKDEPRSIDQDLLPRWNLGDRWVVETVNRPLQVRRGNLPARFAQPIQWQFSVARFEKALKDDCYRIEIACLAEWAQPQTVVWIDKQSMTLRKVQAQIPVPDGFQTLTLNYDLVAGQPAAVVGPLTSLPIDLPYLVAGRTKGIHRFTYESFTGPDDKKKAIGEVGFVHQVEQEVEVVSSSNAKELIGETHAKSLTETPVAEVTLKSMGREIRQLWQPGNPWPVYCDNGATVCRLVKVMRAARNEAPGEEQKP